jgi:hypothetical protein
MDDLGSPLGQEKGRRALRRRPCLATAGSWVRFRCIPLSTRSVPSGAGSRHCTRVWQIRTKVGPGYGAGMDPTIRRFSHRYSPIMPRKVGCRLRSRCPLAQAVCAEPVPRREVAPGRALSNSSHLSRGKPAPMFPDHALAESLRRERKRFCHDRDDASIPKALFSGAKKPASPNQFATAALLRAIRCFCSGNKTVVGSVSSSGH